MSSNSINVAASADAVFAVLDDAYAYPRWVVGTRRIRRVDATWPAVGARFHHAIGTAAAELHDCSTMLERDPPHRVALEVRFRPTGTARVEIDVRTSEAGTLVTLTERPTSGPIASLPRFVVDPVLTLRNALSMQRLRHEIERRGTRSKSPAQPRMLH